MRSAMFISWHRKRPSPESATPDRQADTVLIVAGIQSTRGIANSFFSHLEYLRPRADLCRRQLR